MTLHTRQSTTAARSRHGSVHQAPLRPRRRLPLGARHPLLLHQRTLPEVLRPPLLQVLLLADPQVRHLPGRVGAVRGLTAVHQRDMLLHPGAPELHDVRPAGPGVPQVAVEAGRVRPPAVRPGQVPPSRREQDARVRRRLARQEPHAVSPLPLVQGGVAEGPVGDREDGPGQDSVLRGLQLHHIHLLVAVPGEGGGVGRERRRVQALPRRARRQVVLRRGQVGLRHPLRGQLVHASVHVLRAGAAHRRQLRRAQHHERPHAAVLPPDGVPDGAPDDQRQRSWFQGEIHRADAVADVALRGRAVGQGRGLPADAAVPGQRDGDGRAGAGLLHGAGGGVQGGRAGGAGDGGGHGAHGSHGRDAAAARRAPQPVRALAGREAGAVQRLHPLVPARAGRCLERHVASHAVRLIKGLSIKHSIIFSFQNIQFFQPSDRDLTP